jgi:hypothetical protein
MDINKELVIEQIADIMKKERHNKAIVHLSRMILNLFKIKYFNGCNAHYDLYVRDWKDEFEDNLEKVQDILMLGTQDTDNTVDILAAFNRAIYLYENLIRRKVSKSDIENPEIHYKYSNHVTGFIKGLLVLYEKSMYNNCPYTLEELTESNIHNLLDRLPK